MLIDSHDIEVRVRYCETDAMGYLHHANYFNFFEMARTELSGYRAATIARWRSVDISSSWSISSATTRSRRGSMTC